MSDMIFTYFKDSKLGVQFFCNLKNDQVMDENA
jgi:hypothetical protein